MQEQTPTATPFMAPPNLAAIVGHPSYRYKKQDYHDEAMFDGSALSNSLNYAKVDTSQNNDFEPNEN